ncbi:MAG: hypothetical protein ACFFCH_06290 [Promethearchaeota archaeon]
MTSTSFQWEFEETFRFPTLEFVIAILLIIALTFTKPAWPFVALQPDAPSFISRYVASILDLLIPVAMLFAAVLLTNTIAGGFERRETQLLLSYPVARSRLLLSQILPTYFVFFISLLCAGIILIIQITPLALFSSVYLLLFAGLGFYVLFFISVITLIAVLLRNIKASSIIAILFVFGISFGLNSMIMRFPPGFLSTMITTYFEVFISDSTYYSSINVPFGPVLISYIITTVVALIISWLFYSKFMEV